MTSSKGGGPDLTSRPVETMSDPRMNAPVAVSSLPLEERYKVMAYRDAMRRQQYMDTYRNPQPGFFERGKRRVEALRKAVGL